MLYLGADHRGFALKESLKRYLEKAGVAFEDVGAATLNPTDDYTDYGIAVAEKVSADPTENRGILMCGSGVGMDIVANKQKGVRSALVTDPRQAVAARNDDDTNVLVLEADTTNAVMARDIVDLWLKTPFSGDDRHVRRLKKIAKEEAGR